MAPQVHVLLTATVTPAAGISGSLINDPVTRTAEYVRVLRSLMPLVDKGATVVVAENSDADLTAFREVVGGRPDVELLPCSATTRPEEGKGSAEMALVWEALDRSRLLSRVPPDSLIWKITGRYEVRNFAKLLADPPEVDIYINLRRRPQHWADMWVWAATRHGFDLVRPRGGMLSELAEPRGPAETRMFGLVQALIADGASVCPRLSHEPRIAGVRSFDGRPYNSPRQTAKWVTRSVVRRVAPSIWI